MLSVLVVEYFIGNKKTGTSGRKCSDDFVFDFLNIFLKIKNLKKSVFLSSSSSSFQSRIPTSVNESTTMS